MLRKLLPLLALLAVLVPGALVAAGCGAEEAAGVDVAQAAQATREKGTARMEMQVRMTGFGLPAAMEVSGEGVTDLDEPRMDLTLDLSKVAGALGAPMGDADVRLKVDGADVYVRVPEIPGLELPGGASWAALDLAQVAKAMGFDTKGLGALFQVDPSAQLRAMRAAEGLDEVGEETIGGVRTTHFRGTFTTLDALRALPAAERKEAEAALRGLEGMEETLDDPIPTELWIDEQGVMRRMVSEGEVPSQAGVPGGSMRMSYELSGFGAKLDSSAPPKGDTFDATEALGSILEGGVPGVTGAPKAG